MRIILVRHAQAVDDKLTKLGKVQAKMITNDLVYEGITRIYCSPLSRTVDTAKIIAKKLNTHDIIPDDRITERDQDRSGLTKEELAEYNANYLNPNYSHTSPEGCKEFLSRVHSFLDEVISTNDDSSTVLVVGHSSLSYAFFAYFYHSINSVVWTRMGNTSKLCFESIQKGEVK